MEDPSTGAQNISGIPYPPSSTGGDGDEQSEEDDEDTENEEDDDDIDNEEDDEVTENEENDEDTENEEDDDDECTEYEADDACTATEEDEACDLDDEYESDESEETDEKIPVVEDDFPRLDGINPEMRRTLGKYMKDDRDHIMMCAEGKISTLELMKLMAKDQADLLSGMKRSRSRFEFSEDGEIQEMQDWRAKRMKRGGYAAGECDQPLPWSYGQQIQEGRSSSTGEYYRQGALANTSRRAYNRPVGSAVNRLHMDRFRRPSPKATQTRMPMYPSYPL